MMGLHVKRLGDAGTIPSTLPIPSLPHVPLTLQTLGIIFPVAFAIAVAGLLESLLTAEIVDDLTMSRSNKHRETGGLGIANIVAGFFGGMAGCAMIGQSVINVTAGGRGRLSTFTAGGVLLILMVALNPLVIQVPMAALVAVMIVVSISTFDWSSFKALTVLPKTESIVMLATVGVTLGTNDLALGMIVGVILSGLFFARQVSKFSHITSLLSEDGRVRTYHVYGQLFFVSIHDFVHAFDIHEDMDGVVIDLTRAHLWDSSAIGAIDKVALNYMRLGVKVNLVGMNEASADLVDRLAVHDKPGALERRTAG
jgi:SulP family sulfate permease